MLQRPDPVSRSSGIIALVLLLNLLAAPFGARAAGSADDRWDARFGQPDGAMTLPVVNGANGRINAILIVETNIFVGGAFTRIGDIEANNIALWDGSRWNAVGQGAMNGVNGEVNALELRGSEVCVGGLFTAAGGVGVSNLAGWQEGEGWVPLGAGVNGRVRALAFYQTRELLYVGGDFTSAGGGSHNHIAGLEGCCRRTREMPRPSGQTNVAAGNSRSPHTRG